jgi:hypothetical protein
MATGKRHDRLFQRAERPRRLDKRVNVIDVNEAVAVGARHVVVNLRNYVLGDSGGGKGSVDAHTEAAESV